MLAASYLALSGLDSYTTVVALQRGSEEKNPLLAGMAHNTGTLLATKTALAVGTVLVARRLWTHHRTAGIALMVAANVANAVIVVHNTSVLRNQQPVGAMAIP